jgi:hypothetical protein
MRRELHPIILLELNFGGLESARTGIMNFSLHHRLSICLYTVIFYFIKGLILQFVAFRYLYYYQPLLYIYILPRLHVIKKYCCLINNADHLFPEGLKK